MTDYERVRLEIAARLLAAEWQERCMGTVGQPYDPCPELATAALHGADALLAAAGVTEEATEVERLQARIAELQAALARMDAAREQALDHWRWTRKQHTIVDGERDAYQKMWLKAQAAAETARAEVERLKAAPPHPPGTVAFRQGQVDAMITNLQGALLILSRPALNRGPVAAVRADLQAVLDCLAGDSPEPADDALPSPEDMRAECEYHRILSAEAVADARAAREQRDAMRAERDALAKGRNADRRELAATRKAAEWLVAYDDWVRRQRESDGEVVYRLGNVGGYTTPAALVDAVIARLAAEAAGDSR